MIAFASLFLGLVYGVEAVEVVVGDAVAAVELRLDGEAVRVLRQPPWRAECDFGSELAPRLLEAVAFDAEDRELGRASQWLNLPQPRAAVSVVLEPGSEGGGRVARLTWESAAGAEPESVAASLDGQPLPVNDPHRIALPPVNEKQLHLLHVELRFEGRVASRVDLTFGGAYADEVSTEITALPLVADSSRRRPPSLEEARSWFVKDGETLPVLAIEKETVEVVVVLDRAFPQLVEPGKRYKTPRPLYLAAAERFRFLATVAEQSEGVARTFELFPISPSYGGETGDLYSLLSRMRRLPETRPPRPAAAVAVAGLAAYEGRHRRAVVLVPSQKPRVGEELDAAHVRRYLGRLGVPLYVWDPKSRPAPHLAEWGEVRTVSTLKQLADAFVELAGFLERQWIVWLDGRHLPQDVELAPQAEGFSLIAQ